MELRARMEGGKENCRTEQQCGCLMLSCKVNSALKREVLDSQSEAIHTLPYRACLTLYTGREGSDWALEGSWIQCAYVGKGYAGVEPLKAQGKGRASVLRDIPAPVPMAQSWWRNGSNGALK